MQRLCLFKEAGRNFFVALYKWVILSFSPSRTFLNFVHFHTIYLTMMSTFQICYKQLKKTAIFGH